MCSIYVSGYCIWVYITIVQFLHRINPVVQRADLSSVRLLILKHRPDLPHRESNLWKKIFVQIWKLCKVWSKYDSIYGLSRVPFNWDLCLRQCPGWGLVLIHACEMSPLHRSASWRYRPVSCFFLCVKAYFRVWLDGACELRHVFRGGRVTVEHVHDKTTLTRKITAIGHVQTKSGSVVPWHRGTWWWGCIVWGPISPANL